ncbi:hypothetical protein HZB07_04480 [Candidatus Saganbacteria bacterium]|nr:hypothetical protein [Candidatus Saganbacteria bacterium]
MKTLPKFKSEKKEREFWDTHEVPDYLGDLEEVKTSIRLSKELSAKIFSRKQKRLLTLRLEKGQIEAAKLIASQKSIPYQTLLRMWIMEGINREVVPFLRKGK